MKKETIFTEGHPVIEGILNANRITDEDKLTAIADILQLEHTGKLWPYPEDHDDVDELFEWDNSELGTDFWENIQDNAFESDKRSC
jgi:hypothetical protein